MKIIYVIQDTKTKEYFWQYRINEGWDVSLIDAKEYASLDDALKDMREDYLSEEFEGKTVEIKVYYKFKEC